MSIPVESKDLFVPSLEEVSSVLQRGLSRNFAEVRVEVVDCPDLSSAPFSLAGAGLGGAPRIADVGGPPYLLPLANMDKNYSIPELAKLVDLPDAFIVGAGAGPHKYVGANSEMMANLTTGGKAVNGSRVSKIIGDQYELIKLPQDEPNCAMMLNLFASQGLPGKVLKVRAGKRTGAENFVTCMRKALDEKYQEQSVGLGGIFQLKSGSVKCHIMPEFSTCPLKSDDDVNNWLRFFNMPAPMVFFSVFVSRDPGLDLRIEHSHGYGDSCGGHYHYDVTPDTVEYEGYYNIAETIFRIDRPAVTHNIGRD